MILEKFQESSGGRKLFCKLDYLQNQSIEFVVGFKFVKFKFYSILLHSAWNSSFSINSILLNSNSKNNLIYKIVSSAYYALNFFLKSYYLANLAQTRYFSYGVALQPTYLQVLYSEMEIYIYIYIYQVGPHVLALVKKKKVIKFKF